MYEQVIRDNKGIRGYIRESGSDKLLIGARAPQLGILGRYVEHNNITYDSKGNIVGYGNQLMTLLHN